MKKVIVFYCRTFPLSSSVWAREKKFPVQKGNKIRVDWREKYNRTNSDLENTFYTKKNKIREEEAIWGMRKASLSQNFK